MSLGRISSAEERSGIPPSLQLQAQCCLTQNLLEFPFLYNRYRCLLKFLNLIKSYFAIILFLIQESAEPPLSQATFFDACQGQLHTSILKLIFSCNSLPAVFLSATLLPLPPFLALKFLYLSCA